MISETKNKNISSPAIHDTSLICLNADNNKNNIETLSTIVK